MSDAYHELLDATIRHLETLKASGVRYISLSPEAIASLNGSRQRRSVSARRPAPAVAPQRVAAAPAPPAAPVAAPKTAQPDPVPAAVATASPALPSLGPEAKAAAFADLRERVLACIRCPHLASSRKNVVFGVGNIDAELMFVGEAPGADEDEQGEPFVGKAGQLLTKIIQAMNLTRERVYIANILKCRPDTPGQTTGNRKPTPQEMQTCIPFLHEQIDLIRPKVLVALGSTAVEGLLGKTAGITRLRGTWQTYRGIPLMPTYHPAYLLRNQAPAEKRKVWEDMLQVMERLGMPISEKQRRYFLSASAS
ncbi:MAG TPA: uracil-DNA glycosylase [Verrucomicrobia bacterium]|nr:uracil-DNA glycosylase [Verrucomicrobiota bacterium]HOB31486.1 uracil-DNA glycosylase family protein [Verrucomicrobiota bacterium]HOP98222.1 uracil-DNA glycosylase family protein [Verrucomicrobiota bacterium]HPU57508.1 uracil-DNA glycosylase family protein [Verrucomicrobiota bacterium]